MPEPRSTTNALADHVCFLLSQVGSHAAHRFRQLLEPIGLTPRQFGVLSHLIERDGQSQQQLADTIGVHPNVMVGLVDELEERGLVERRTDPTNRRAYAVHVQPPARELFRRAAGFADDCDRELLDALDTDEQRALLPVLQRIAAGYGLTPGVHPGLARM
jgi:DNA-binding MarR family transcriptional regulator